MELIFKASTPLLTESEKFQDSDYFDAFYFYMLDYLTSCEEKLGQKRKVFVDFSNVKDYEMQRFWIGYLRCYGEFIPINIDISLTDNFSKIASGSSKTTPEEFKAAIEFYNDVGGERAIIVVDPFNTDFIRKLNTLPSYIFEAEILVWDSNKLEDSIKFFNEMNDGKFKIDYMIAGSPTVYAANGTRLDHAGNAICSGSLYETLIRKHDQKLAIQNIKAFKKLANGQTISQEDFV